MVRLLFLLLFSSFSLFSFGQLSKNIDLLDNWRSDTLDTTGFFANGYNEVWGFVQDGVEYAVIGTFSGTHILDISDPTDATEVAFVKGTFSQGVVIHRDFHDYNGYLYMVADEGPSALQIADLSYLPDSAPLVYESTDLIARSHNIFIDSATARLYACGSGYHMKVMSLDDPENPELLLTCNTDIDFWPSEVGYIHDMFVRNDTAWLNAPDQTGLVVVDFSDTNNVTILGSLTTYPDQGYNHSGWLNGPGNLYAMADETQGAQLKILDVSDLSDIKIDALTWSGVNDSLGMLHNLIIKGEDLFVSHYHDGLYIFNLHDPSNPINTGYYDTSTESHDILYRGCWGVYPFLPSGIVLASDRQNGLFIFDVSTAVSVEDLSAEEHQLQLYPNPASDFLRVQWPVEAGKVMDYKIVNVFGKLIQSGQIDAGHPQISLKKEMSAGLYFFQMNSGKFAQAERLIKIK